MTLFTIIEAQVQHAFDILSATSGPESAKGLNQVLQDGKKFKESGLTPIYIYDDITQTIVATSIERMSRNLDG